MEPYFDSCRNITLAERFAFHDIREAVDNPREGYSGGTVIGAQSKDGKNYIVRVCVNTELVDYK